MWAGSEIATEGSLGSKRCKECCVSLCFIVEVTDPSDFVSLPQWETQFMFCSSRSINNVIMLIMVMQKYIIQNEGTNYYVTT